MAKTQTEQQTDQSAPVAPVVPPTPAHGGSYLLDDTTGEHTLIERTQPNTQARSKP